MVAFGGVHADLAVYRRSADRRAITDLVRSYGACIALDDLDRWIGLFTADAAFSTDAVPVDATHGRTELGALVHRTRHGLGGRYAQMLASVVVELDEEDRDRAEGRVHGIVSFRRADGVRVVRPVRYEDVYRREVDGWRIAVRHLHPLPVAVGSPTCGPPGSRQASSGGRPEARARPG